MKPQDIVFILILVLLLVRRNPKIAVASGLACLVLSIPLFSLWVFFTAERLTYYAAAFFFAAIVFYAFQLRK